MSLRARLHNRWSPKYARGATGQERLEKLQEWIKSNRTPLLVGSAIVVVVIIAVMWNRSRSSGAYVGRRGAAVAEEQKQVSQETPQAPQAAPQAPQGAACPPPVDPIAFNYFQSDLGSVNDTSMGPGVAFNGAQGLPVDYAGACNGVNPAAVWQSSQLLPANCGQSMQGTDDWSLYAPSNAQLVNFLSAGQNFGQDTISTTLKNANLSLRPEPPVCSSFQSPWNQSSWVDTSMMPVDWSHSLVA